MRRASLISGMVFAALAARADAQVVRLRADVVHMTYQEARAGRDGSGTGAGFGLEFRVHRFRVDGRALFVNITPDDGSVATGFDATQIDVRVGYAVTQFLQIEAGGGRRYIDPDFLAQEVGLARIGLFSENRVSRIASFWLRGAYLFATEFTGGGSSDLAFELGLGVGVGTPNGRFRVHSEYEFQRIDRSVNAVDVPIQTSVARFGIAIGF